MVEDSIVEKFSGSPVSVAGVDIWNSSDSLIKSFIETTGITFPVAKRGGATGNAYSVVANSMVVIDQNGVVRFVQELGTASTTYPIMRKMVSDAASTVRGLLANRVIAFGALGVPANSDRTGLPGYYTLSGRMQNGPVVTAGAGIVVRKLNGRMTAIRVMRNLSTCSGH